LDDGTTPAGAARQLIPLKPSVKPVHFGTSTVKGRSWRDMLKAQILCSAAKTAALDLLRHGLDLSFE
jgi:hypothetical protein